MSREFFLVVHLAAVISWMAGVLYLIRLLINHVDEPEMVVRRKLEGMEERLYRIIARPAMIVSFLAGFGLISKSPQYYFSSLWFILKFVCVLMVAASTELANHYRKKLLRGEKIPSAKALRFFNEVPTILMILILILVIYKPW